MIIVQTCGWSFLLGLNVVGWVWLCDISESEQTPRFLSLLKLEKKRKGAPLLMEKKRSVSVYFLQVRYHITFPLHVHIFCVRIPCERFVASVLYKTMFTRSSMIDKSGRQECFIMRVFEKASCVLNMKLWKFQICFFC